LRFDPGLVLLEVRLLLGLLGCVLLLSAVGFLEGNT